MLTLIPRKPSWGTNAARTAVSDREYRENKPYLTDALIGFVDNRTIRVFFRVGTLSQPARRDYVPAPGDSITRSADLNSPNDGQATLADGTKGFTSRGLTDAPTILPLATYTDTQWAPLLAGTTKPVDVAANWDLTITGAPLGAPATVSPLSPTHRLSLLGRSERSLPSFGNKATGWHYVTLRLPAANALTLGQSVQVKCGGLTIGGTAGQTLTLGTAVYSHATVSPAIHVCQEGYEKTGTKEAFVGGVLGYTPDGTTALTVTSAAVGQAFWLERMDTGAEIAGSRGTLALAKDWDPAAAQTTANISPTGPWHRRINTGTQANPVWVYRNHNQARILKADFSGVQYAGLVRLVVEGVGCSMPFEISDNRYAPWAYWAWADYKLHMRGITLGPAEDPDFGHTKPIGHPLYPRAVPTLIENTTVKIGPTNMGWPGNAARSVFSLTGTYGLNNPANQLGTYNPNAWGGMRDAADWDPRSQHADETVYPFCALLEYFPEARALKFEMPKSPLTTQTRSGAAFNELQTLMGSTFTAADEAALPDIAKVCLWILMLWIRTQNTTAANPAAGLGGCIGGVEYSAHPHRGALGSDPWRNAFAYAVDEWSTYKCCVGFATFGRTLKYLATQPGGLPRWAALGDFFINRAILAWNYNEPRWATLDATTKSNSTDLRLDSAAALFRAVGNTTFGLQMRDLWEANSPWRTAAQGDERAWDYFMATAPTTKGGLGIAGNETIRTRIIDSYRNQGSWTRMGNDWGIQNTNNVDSSYDTSATSAWILEKVMKSVRARMYDGTQPYLRATSRAIGAIPANQTDADAIYSSLWFAMGCNMQDMCHLTGAGQVFNDDPVYMSDGEDGLPVKPGHLTFGTYEGGGNASGLLAPTASGGLGIAHPADQAKLPTYGNAHPNKSCIETGEYGMKSIAKRWAIALTLERVATAMMLQ